MKPVDTSKTLAPWLMLAARTLLFLSFQLLTTLLLLLIGQPDSWWESSRWWALFVIPANLTTVYLLVRLYKAEGKRYLDIFRFPRATLGKDLLWLLAAFAIGAPIMAAPMNTLAALIYGDPMAPVNMMFRPLPGWATVVAVLFPLTITFAELPAYFGYVMPRLALQIKNGWVAWLLAAFFLAAQHCFLPLILDSRFILWRLGMFLPFALFTGLVIKLRPGLLPYFAIGHALLDFSTLMVYWMI